MGIQVNTKKILYVSNWFENKISIIDINKNKVLSKINVGNSPAGIFLSNDKKLFIALKGDNLVSVYDLISKKIRDINVGKAPYGVFSEKNRIIICYKRPV